jgi:hypothetical protein
MPREHVRDRLDPRKLMRERLDAIRPQPLELCSPSGEQATLDISLAHVREAT